MAAPPRRRRRRWCRRSRAPHRRRSRLRLPPQKPFATALLITCAKSRAARVGGLQGLGAMCRGWAVEWQLGCPVAWQVSSRLCACHEDASSPPTVPACLPAAHRPAQPAGPVPALPQAGPRCPAQAVHPAALRGTCGRAGVVSPALHTTMHCQCCIQYAAANLLLRSRQWDPCGGR